MDEMIDETGTPGPPGDPGADAQGPDVVGFAPVGPDGVPVPIYAAADRPRGLNAYFAPGGEDDAPEERRRDEQRMVRLLVIFVALLVIIPTVLTIIGFASELLTMRSAG